MKAELEKVAEEYVKDDTLKPWRNLCKEAFMAGARWQEKQVDDIVRLHFDKSLQNYSDSRAEEGEESTSTCYWDGYSDCAKCIMREL